MYLFFKKIHFFIALLAHFVKIIKLTFPLELKGTHNGPFSKDIRSQEEVWFVQCGHFPDTGERRFFSSGRKTFCHKKKAFKFFESRCVRTDKGIEAVQIRETGQFFVILCGCD